MAEKADSNSKGEVDFKIADVDGMQRSTRHVPSELLCGLDGDEPANQAIADQDAQIAEKSSKPPIEIASVERVWAKKK